MAFTGGLNCGKCTRTIAGQPVSCADAPVCEHWILHRFRENFATDRHEAGASARKIQKWLGHESLETTLRYLASSEDTSESVREICNSVHAGLRSAEVLRIASRRPGANVTLRMCRHAI